MHFHHILGYSNSLNAGLNPICRLLALLAHHILHVSGVRVTNTVLDTHSTVNAIYREQKIFRPTKKLCCLNPKFLHAVVPHSKVSHLPTDALFITLGKV
jgi:hypothetical protein